MNKLNLSLSLGLLFSPLAGNAAPVIELFTSQGCYSCPAADEYLGEIISNQPDVVALEYHVDYWDDLNYGAAGVWKDPFSDPSYSARQRRYNAVGLAGKSGVYTPQMVINGNTAQVGTSRRAVQRAIDKKPPKVKLDALLADSKLSVDIKGKHKGGSTLWLAIFDRVQMTEVVRGENHGKTMVNHHVVRELVSLGQWQGDKVSQTFQVSAVNDANSGCAVFLQNEALGQIHAATYCR